MRPIFGDYIPSAPNGYAKKLVTQILKENPGLKGQALIDEVNKRKMYEINVETITRYSRKI